MAHFSDLHGRTGRSDPKSYKTTLAGSRRLMPDLKCLEADQAQSAHSHARQDKFYLVVEGRGLLTVRDVRRVAGPDPLTRAPVEMDHGVEHMGDRTLVLLIWIRDRLAGPGLHGAAGSPGNPCARSCLYPL